MYNKIMANPYSRQPAGALTGEMTSNYPSFQSWLSTLKLKADAIEAISQQRERAELKINGGGSKFEKRFEDSFLKLGELVGDHPERRVDSVNIAKPLEKDIKKRTVRAVTITGALLEVVTDEKGTTVTYFSSNGKAFVGKLNSDTIQVVVKKDGGNLTLIVPSKEEHETETRKPISKIAAIATFEDKIANN